MIGVPAIAPPTVEQMGWGLLLSLGLHVLLVALAMVLPGMLDGSRRVIFAPAYNVNLVGTPRFIPSPPAPPALPPKVKTFPKPQAEPAAPPKPQPKPKEAIATKRDQKAKRVKRKKKEAIATKGDQKTKRVKRKKNEGADSKRVLDRRLKRLQSKVREEQRLAEALTRAERKAAARPGGVAGGASQGAPNRLSMRFQVYYTELRSQVYSKWILPEAYVRNPQGLVAIVSLRIQRDGSLEKVWLERSSGNQRLDQSALRAVRMAAPYPPLPSGLHSPYHEVGIRFRPEDALR